MTQLGGEVGRGEAAGQVAEEEVAGYCFWADRLVAGGGFRVLRAPPGAAPGLLAMFRQRLIGDLDQLEVLFSFVALGGILFKAVRMPALGFGLVGLANARSGRPFARGRESRRVRCRLAGAGHRGISLGQLHRDLRAAFRAMARLVSLLPQSFDYMRRRLGRRSSSCSTGVRRWPGLFEFGDFFGQPLALGGNVDGALVDDGHIEVRRRVLAMSGGNRPTRSAPRLRAPAARPSLQLPLTDCLRGQRRCAIRSAPLPFLRRQFPFAIARTSTMRLCSSAHRIEGSGVVGAPPPADSASSAIDFAGGLPS